MSADDAVRRTPLYERHLAAGARMVEFAGFLMPVQYTSVMEEHRAVRGEAGLFDVSHMGELVVRGPGAEAFVQRLTPNDVSKLAPGRAHYSGLLTEEGTYIDDLLVYRLGEEEILLVVNAANRAEDLRWVEGHAAGVPGVTVEDRSEETALLALQGPRAVEILAGLTPLALPEIRYYGFARGQVAGEPALVSRTGYTGEDGFELYLEPARAAEVWDALLAAGRPRGLMPAGLGARDTLRLEAGMALYGHEIDRGVTPWEAGLGWVVKLDPAAGFIGAEALRRQQAEGVPRRLVGFEVTGRGIARQGHPVRAGAETVGTVTSGTFSPTLEKAVGMALVAASAGEVGKELAVEVRGREIPIRLVELPFYRRPR